jgi:S-adenosylmethionine:diacylglycerol 3-amino-3-carboxypropyl transferase
MHINGNDTVLTLTSGGCNALNLLLHGAGHVVSVDCNPAQSSLLQLKATAIQQLEFEDVWQVCRGAHVLMIVHTHLDCLMLALLPCWSSSTHIHT